MRKDMNWMNRQVKVANSSFDAVSWACIKLSLMFFGITLATLFPQYIFQVPYYYWLALFIIFMVPPAIMMMKGEQKLKNKGR